MKIALTGNPNSGKTTLFNAITGKIEHVGNWPGVTVEKKEGSIKDALNPGTEELTVVDLPGAYSMSPYTSEESITKDFVKNESPDVIINIVDAGNLSRSLFFTTQLMELNIPVVIALNKSDMNEKKEIFIDTLLLSDTLKCPVIETIATKTGNNGLEKLVESAITVLQLRRKDSRLSISGVKRRHPPKKKWKLSTGNALPRVNDIVDQVERRKISSSSPDRSGQGRQHYQLTRFWACPSSPL